MPVKNTRELRELWKKMVLIIIISFGYDYGSIQKVQIGKCVLKYLFGYDNGNSKLAPIGEFVIKYLFWL